jgi:hypothetical protein
MAEKGIVTDVAWFLNQVALTVDYDEMRKSVVILSPDQFVAVFGLNLLGTDNHLSLSDVVNMWVETDVTESGTVEVSKSFPKALRLDVRLGSLTFSKQEDVASEVVDA